MKKKLLTVLLLTGLSLTIFACGKENTENKNDSTTPEPKTTAPKDTEKDPGNNTNDTKTDSGEKTLSDLENYLLDKNILSGERIEPLAELIGAKAGFKYVDSSTEVYEFDTNSDAYKKLSNGEEIALEGMEGVSLKASSVNGCFALFGEPSQEVIDAFDSFK